MDEESQNKTEETQESKEFSVSDRPFFPVLPPETVAEVEEPVNAVQRVSFARQWPIYLMCAKAIAKRGVMDRQP